MTDHLTLLQTATLQFRNGDDAGEIIGFGILDGKLTLFVESDGETFDDDDDGEEVPTDLGDGEMAERHPHLKLVSSRG